MPDIVSDRLCLLDGRLIDGIQGTVLVDAQVHTNAELRTDVAKDPSVLAHQKEQLFVGLGKDLLY